MPFSLVCSIFKRSVNCIVLIHTSKSPVFFEFNRVPLWYKKLERFGTLRHPHLRQYGNEISTASWYSWHFFSQRLKGNGLQTFPFPIFLFHKFFIHYSSILSWTHPRMEIKTLFGVMFWQTRIFYRPIYFSKNKNFPLIWFHIPLIFALTTRLLRNNNNNIFHPSRRSSKPTKVHPLLFVLCAFFLSFTIQYCVKKKSFHMFLELIIL